MAREIINVGATPNDGQGDPIRTAFTKSNDNFAELYSRAQTNVPTSLTGSPGDRAGMYAADANTFYWCFQDYDGSSVIWAETTNSQITDLINGSSNVSVASSANVTVSVDGVSNVAQFSASLATLANVLVPGTLSVAGNSVLANVLPATDLTHDLGAADLRWRSLYVGGNTIFLGAAEISTAGDNIVFTAPDGSEFTMGGGGAGAPATGEFGDITATGNVEATGNITAAFFSGDGSQLTGISESGNTISDGASEVRIIDPDGNIQANVAGAVIHTTSSQGLVVSGNVSAGNIISGNDIEATGNISAAFFAGDGSQLTGISTTGNTITNGTSEVRILSAGGNIQTNVNGNIIHTTSSQGLAVTGVVTASGNVSAGNVITTGVVETTGVGRGTQGFVFDSGGSTGNVDVFAGNLNVNGNVWVAEPGTVGFTNDGTTIGVGRVGGPGFVFTGTGSSGNLLVVAGNADFTGNISAVSFVGDGSQLTGISTTGNTITDGTSEMRILSAGGNIRANVAGAAIHTTSSQGLAVTGVVTATGNVSAGNVITTGVVETTGVGRGTQGFVFDSGGITGNVDVFAGNLNVNGNVWVAEPGTVGFTNDGSNIGIGRVGGPGFVFTGTGSSGNLLVVAGNADFTGNILAGNVNATNLTGTLQTASQPNITGLGTLTSLTVTGNVSGGNITTAGVVETTAVGRVGGTGLTFSATPGGNITVNGGNVNYDGTIFANGSGVTNLNMNNAASGTLAVARGGTGAASLTSGSVLVGAGTGAVTGVSPGTNGNVLTVSGGVWVSAAPSSGSSDSISDGTSNMTVIATNGNIRANVAGAAIHTTSSQGLAVTGVVTASGNISGGNLSTTGVVETTGVGRGEQGLIFDGISSTGNISVIAGNVNYDGIINANGSGVTNLNMNNAASGTLAVARGGTGSTSAQTAINALAGVVTSGQYLRGNGSNVVMSAIQAGDVPTLNQNTTGSAATVTNAAQGNITSVGTLTSLTVTGNVSGGNITTAGVVETTAVGRVGGTGLTFSATPGGNITVNGGNVNYDGTIFANGSGLNNLNASNVTSGTLAVARGGTGAATAQTAINALAGAVTSGQYLRGNGSNVVMSAIQAGDVPTLNQNTTGIASNVSGVVALGNGGTGATVASTARSNLGLGSMATQDSNSVSISGGSISNMGAYYTNASLTAGLLQTTASDMGVGFTAGNALSFNGTSTAGIAQFGTTNVQKPGGGTFQSTSDARLKQDIQSYAKGINDLMALRPVTYRYSGKLGEQTAYAQFAGLIAQEVQDTGFASMVATGPDDYLRIDSSELTYALINAVKELNYKISQQEQRISELEARLAGDAGIASPSE